MLHHIKKLFGIGPKVKALTTVPNKMETPVGSTPAELKLASEICRDLPNPGKPVPATKKAPATKKVPAAKKVPVKKPKSS